MITRTHTLHLTQEELEEMRWFLRDSIESLDYEIRVGLATEEDRGQELAALKSLLSKIEEEVTMPSHTYDPKFYYFTCDSDAGKIDRGARFYRAASKHEMLSQMQDRCFTEITGVEEGYFSDCWAKITRAPTEDDFERWSDEYGLPSDTFIVRAPGTHPGGNFWWVDLAIPVYVPIFKIKEEA